MIVLISGFSGSGKSYLANYLSKKLKLKVIHTSDILKQISDGKIKKINIHKTKMNTGWYEHSNLDVVRTKNNNIDIILDKYLLNLIETKDKLVLDSWTLPYLSDKGIRIWLHCNFNERVRRLAIRDNISINKAVELIKKKDTFSKKQFNKLYKFKLGEDLTRFNYILNTSNLSIKEVEDKVLEFIKNHSK